MNLTLAIPPVTLRMPLASDPRLCVAVHPPVAHWGPGPVKMRLISHTLREGQVRRNRSSSVEVLVVSLLLVVGTGHHVVVFIFLSIDYIT